MTWQRARKPDQKADRVSAILNAATALFDQQDIGEIAMRDVATAAGMSKASLYSYFKTKEEVFATLFLIESERWFGHVQPKLKRLKTPTASRVAKLLTDTLRDSPRLCRLTVILSSVLEKNLSTDFLREFKMELHQSLTTIIAQFQKSFPRMSEESGMEFLYLHHALIAGLWPVAHPSKEIEAVLQATQFQSMRVDFYQVFQDSIELFLGSKSGNN